MEQNNKPVPKKGIFLNHLIPKKRRSLSKGNQLYKKRKALKRKLDRIYKKI